jgi:hypothetical protein
MPPPLDERDDEGRQALIGVSPAASGGLGV